MLLELSAGTVRRTSMELGGNAPFLVFDDADLTAAVDGAIAAKFRNVGQACTAANRFLVQRCVAEDFHPPDRRTRPRIHRRLRPAGTCRHRTTHRSRGVKAGVVSDAAAPFGGWKQSGLGREGGPEGIHEYLQSKYTLAAAA